LRALQDSGRIRTPKILEVSEDYLRLEFIETEGKTEVFWKQLGRELAELHQSKAPQLGLDSDNFIGLTGQKNTPFKVYRSVDDWVQFFWDYRIEFQLEMLRKKQISPDLFKNFESAKETIFKKLSRSSEEPCLLHGDLWSGNVL